MAEELKVADTKVPELLNALRKGEWLVPEFQRDFVWSTEQVSALIQSILESRPIGMVSLWEQSEEDQIPLERLSIPDFDAASKKKTLRYFGSGGFPKKHYAILDGKQRCTAIAMAFGGFRAHHGLYKYSGRYYLDVTENDPRKRVKFFKENDVKKLSLDIDANCVGRGLFPLASNIEEEPVLSQWMRYLQALEKSDNYPNSVMPTKEELGRRNNVLQEAFEGLVNTKLAVYTVPEKYSLGEICEIFENLNQTGTKVSTVDLIHSWLYNDTFSEGNPMLLRDWISDLGEKDGAIGWANREDRPELVAQLVTGCYIALKVKPPAKGFGKGKKPPAITSVKAADLLAVPTSHWKFMRDNDDLLAQYLGDAQRVIAGGYFPYLACPYPVTLAIYIGLRWHVKFDTPDTHPWAIDELDALFRAFFWRNALSRRYDQGFLSQLGTDMEDLRAMLNDRPAYKSSGEWATKIEPKLSKLIGPDKEVPSLSDLTELVVSGPLDGAIQKAILLPMLAGVRNDLVDSNLNLAYPSAIPLELHHIYPREWCRSHISGPLKTVLDPEKAGRNYVNSAANLMPLSRISNNSWKQKFPASFLAEKKIEFEPNEKKLRPIFIDEKAFKILLSGENALKEFWDYRGALIAQDLIGRTKIVL